MRERIPPSVGHLAALDRERCVLETGAQRPDVLGYHLAMLGVDFVVLEPAELREHMRSLAKRLQRAGTVRGSRSGVARAGPSRVKARS
jgi:predicted DNA-binding transcriptional regulator YafY